MALFVERAAMAGWSSPYPDDRRRIAAICDELDGIALAIELAAARLATFGLDGLEAGLADRLGLLAGGPRLDDRHRSVRSALDWSFGLLDEKDRVVLRRASVFAAPFTSGAAATVTGHRAADARRGGGVAGSPRRAQPAAGGRRSEAAPATGCWRRSASTAPSGWPRSASRPRCEGRHLRWCLATAARLQAANERPWRASTRSPTTCGPGSAGRRPTRTSGSTPTSWPCAWPSSASPGGCRARPSGGTRRRPRWPPIPPTRPAPCTSERPSPGAGTRATRRYGSTAPAAEAATPGRRPGGAPPSSSRPRPSSSAAHRAPWPSWCRPARQRALLAEAVALAADDAQRRGGRAHRHRRLSTSATRRPPNSSNAPSSWPTGWATPAWRAAPSTS